MNLLSFGEGFKFVYKELREVSEDQNVFKHSILFLLVKNYLSLNLPVTSFFGFGTVGPFL